MSLRLRASAAVLDQLLWAAGNFSLLVVFAAQASVVQFGYFGVLTSVLVILAGSSIALGGEVSAVTRGLVSAEEFALVQRRSFAAVLSVVALSVAVVGVLSAAIPGETIDGDFRLLVWAAAPFAVLAEGLRSLAYAALRIPTAFCLSLGWLLAQVVVWTALSQTSGLSPTGVVVGWLAGAAMASLAGLALLRLRPSWHGLREPVEQTRRKRFAAEFLLTSGPTQATVWLSGGLLSLADAGILRAMQAVFGPLNVVSAALRNALVPIRSGTRGRALLRTGLLSLGVLGSVTLIGIAAVLIWAEQVSALMNGIWPTSLLLVLVFGISRLAVMIIQSAVIVLRIGDRTEASFRLRILTAVSSVATFAAAAPWGLMPALAASTAAALLMSLLWWRSAVRATREDGAPVLADRTVPEPG